FNRRQGPMSDPAQRRRFAAALDAPLMVKQTLGRRAIPAHGLIPPGLIGHEAAPAAPAGPMALAGEDHGVPTEFLASVHPTFMGEHAGFYAAMEGGARAPGITVRTANRGVSDYLDSWTRGNTHMVIGRWLADYPDADTFFSAFRYAWPYVGSPDLDALIQRGRSESDPAARHALYREIEGTL